MSYNVCEQNGLFIYYVCIVSIIHSGTACCMFVAVGHSTAANLNPALEPDSPAFCPSNTQATPKPWRGMFLDEILVQIEKRMQLYQVLYIDIILGHNW